MSSSPDAGPCRFGAPLVATALQRVGALGERIDPATVTPATLLHERLVAPAVFAQPITLRSGGLDAS